MRYIRVRSVNGPLFARLLREAGFQAEWLGSLGPSVIYTNPHYGCGDPSCCTPSPPQDKQDWGTIKTNASGNKAHRIWKSHGLVKSFWET